MSGEQIYPGPNYNGIERLEPLKDHEGQNVFFQDGGAAQNGLYCTNKQLS